MERCVKKDRMREYLQEKEWVAEEVKRRLRQQVAAAGLQLTVDRSRAADDMARMNRTQGGKPCEPLTGGVLGGRLRQWTGQRQCCAGGGCCRGSQMKGALGIPCAVHGAPEGFGARQRMHETGRFLSISILLRILQIKRSWVSHDFKNLSEIFILFQKIIMKQKL